MCPQAFIMPMESPSAFLVGETEAGVKVLQLLGCAGCLPHALEPPSCGCGTRCVQDRALSRSSSRSPATST